MCAREVASSKKIVPYVVLANTRSPRSESIFQPFQDCIFSKASSVQLCIDILGCINSVYFALTSNMCPNYVHVRLLACFCQCQQIDLQVVTGLNGKPGHSMQVRLQQKLFLLTGAMQTTENAELYLHKLHGRYGVWLSTHFQHIMPASHIAS